MRVPPNNYDSEIARCYDPSMSEKDDNLINFIATTVEALRAGLDTISEQMVTKVDVANLRDEMTTLRAQMATKDDLVAIRNEMATKDDLVAIRNETKAEFVVIRNEMATKDDLAALRNETKAEFVAIRNEMATKNDMSRLETTMRGEFEQVHIRFDSMDRRVNTRMGQIETDVSRLRSVVYLLVKDKPDMLRLLGKPTSRENFSEG
jgi:ribosomal protein L29